MYNFLKDLFLEKSIDYLSKSNWRNWWIIKLLFYLGAIVGYTLFFAIARQIIFDDFKWYWKLLMLVLSVGLLYDIFKRISLKIKSLRQIREK